MEPILRENPTLFEPWMIFVFIVSLGFLAYIRKVYSKRFGLLLKTALRLQILRQVMREELLFSHRASLVLFTHFILMSAILLYGANNYYGVISNSRQGFVGFLVIALALLVLYLLKFSLIGFLKWLYQDEGLLREYRFEVFSVCKILGLVFLPLAVLSMTLNQWSLSWVFPLAGIIFVAAFVFRVIQGLALSFSYSVSPIYIILYLCTLEILPFILLISVFR